MALVRHLRTSATIALLVTVIATALGCSASKAKQLSEQGVAKFHAQLDAEQYHDIYTQASTEFQKSDSESAFTEFLSAVHRKLGRVQNSEEQTFFINFGASGTTVTLTQKTTFANGPATEEFVWRVGEQPVLVKYRIDSRVLITK